MIGLNVLEILPFYDFGMFAEMGLFGSIFGGFGDFEPLNCDIGVLTPNVIQRSHKDVL